jgi:hypothetical protein
MTSAKPDSDVSSDAALSQESEGGCIHESVRESLAEIAPAMSAEQTNPESSASAQPLPNESDSVALGAVDSGTNNEKARPLRCCAHPLFDELEKLAEKHPEYRPVLLAMAWRVHMPPSLRALSIVAGNLRRSLILLRDVFAVDLDERGLASWLEPLEWLALDSQVRALTCPLTTRPGNPLHYHCASTHSIYAMFGEEAGQEINLIRSVLILMYINDAESRVPFDEYERHLRNGFVGITLKGHVPDEARRAIHYFASESDTAITIIPEATSLDELIARISTVVIPDSKDAIRHWSELRKYVQNMWRGIASDRRTTIFPKLHTSPSSAQNRSTTRSRQTSYTVHGPSGAARITRYMHPLTDRKRRELAARDIPPDEDTGIGIFFIIKEKIDRNVEKSVRDARFRLERRMLHRPVDLITCYERNLSQDEVGVVFRDARKLVLDYTAQGYHDPNLKRALQVSAGSLISYFTRSEPEEASELIVLSPKCQNADAELAIFLADDSRHDYFRIQAIDYGYRSDKFDAKSFRVRSDYVYLPLPPIASLVVRALLADGNGQLSILEPVRVMRMSGIELEAAIRSKLKKLDPTGRLTPGRLQRSFFASLVAETGGDLAVTSLILAKPHPSVHAELYYLAIGLRSAAELYRRVSRKIHAATFPNWTPIEAAIEDFVADLDVGCRYYPIFEELREKITTICDLAREAWRRIARIRNINVHDPEFERNHNMVTLALTLTFSYSTGVRAITSPLPFLKDIEEVLDQEGHVKCGIADWTDKDNGSRYHKRELYIVPDTMAMLRAYQKYLDRVCAALRPSKEAGHLPAFFLVKGQAVAISPKSIAEVGGGLYAYPPNSHRRVLIRGLRAGILESRAGIEESRQCSPEIIRAGILGHWTTGQEPWSELSNLPLRAIEDALLLNIPKILEKLGFVSFLKSPEKHND